MKVIFHPKFYESYTSDPAAAKGRMEAITRELKVEFKFIEPGPASENDLERSMEGNTSKASRGILWSTRSVSSLLEEPFYQQRWLLKANQLSVCISPEDRAGMTGSGW
jgi:hypothetical protein